MLQTAETSELQAFQVGSVLSFSAATDGLTFVFFLLSALCSVSAITSGNLSTEVANFRFQLPLQTPDSHGFTSVQIKPLRWQQLLP